MSASSAVKPSSGPCVSTAWSASLRVPACQHSRDDALGCPLQQVPDEGAADAEAQHQELPDAQVIHQAELVVGVCVPGPVDLERAGGLAAVGVAQVCRDTAVLVLELLDRVDGA